MADAMSFNSPTMAPSGCVIVYSTVVLGPYRISKPMQLLALPHNQPRGGQETHLYFTYCSLQVTRLILKFIIFWRKEMNIKIFWNSLNEVLNVIVSIKVYKYTMPYV